MRTSVIIPYYNARPTIERSLDSVYAQERQADEVVVVDDGSDSLDAEYLSALQKRYGFINIQRANSGTAGARNTGAKVAQGDLFAFLDADDIWDRRYLATHLPVFANDDVGIVFSRLEWMDGNDRPIGVANRAIPKPSLERVLLGNFIGSGSNFIIRRECLADIGDFDENLFGTEDHLLAIRFFLHQRWIAVQVPEILVKYRRTPDSKSRQSRQMISDLLKIHGLIKDGLTFRQRLLSRLGIIKIFAALNSMNVRRMVSFDGRE